MRFFNALVLVSLLVTTCLVAWLAVGQARLQSRMDQLSAENQKLAHDLTRQSITAAQGAREAQAQLDSAQALAALVESRLRNTGNAQEQAIGMGTGALGSRAGPRQFGPRDISSAARTFEPLTASCSHTPDGQLRQRNWGPEQLVGPPNTFQAGDLPTAWAPRDSSGTGEEWLHLDYEHPVEIAAVNVRETYNPGAVSKLAAVLDDGREVVIWEGVEPRADAPVDMSFTASTSVQARAIKVYLDRTRVPGWNEIDAVELIGRNGLRQWAASATTSTSYAER